MDQVSEVFDVHAGVYGGVEQGSLLQPPLAVQPQSVSHSLPLIIVSVSLCLFTDPFGFVSEKTM